MLKELDLASQEQILRILGVFDSLDIEEDGVLDINDVRREMKRRGELTSREFNDIALPEAPDRQASATRSASHSHSSCSHTIPGRRKPPSAHQNHLV